MEINAPSEGLLCFGLMADKQMNKVKKGNKKNNSKQRMSRRIERHTRLFTALHGVQTRSSDENSFCPFDCLSVCLSNAWIVIKRKKDLSRFLYLTTNYLT